MSDENALEFAYKQGLEYGEARLRAELESEREDRKQAVAIQTELLAQRDALIAAVDELQAARDMGASVTTGAGEEQDAFNRLTDLVRAIKSGRSEDNG